MRRGADIGMLIVASLCAIGTRDMSAQSATFRARVESVRLDALITEGGRPVRGLTPADFDIVDNGVRQSVDYVSLDELPVNVVSVLDMSESVSGTAIEQLRLATSGIARGLRAGDQTALLTFNHRVTLGLPLTQDVHRMGPALEAISPEGGTALIDAVYSSLWIAEPDPGRTVIIVFSDGLDTASWLSRERVLEASKRVDATVYAVTSGSRRNPFLSDITESSGGRTFDAASPDRISAAFASILQEFRERYVISYSPTGVASRGWHKVDLRVKGRRASVRVRAGYLAGPD